ncbi:hypothetical protein P170DRAFT_432661 [Aspergillus steynii IBT 23096]|uniref:Microbial-type PARG catalytic domain-containing protein n=1 Tax=Aspergillus steynii IBT 23096 TaxID=1392250 RepID=A0A2I2GQH2_9EURO|nr:uncharacterized protein P170DRAFT_432661 [Aspergillus steynii IBT 23096]PLB55120.1 hypothetical protein P170DRAFT_432661 [Aspergillus steynii IBT 23096]
MAQAFKIQPSGSKPDLRKVAEETKALLPGVLALKPQAPPNGHYCPYAKMAPLDPKYHPNLVAKVSVINGDTFDTARSLSNPANFNSHHAKHVCVLNMANQVSAGGGWLNGAMAQEEELCYRSSLSFTLKRRHYPMGTCDVLYSPTVVVFRDNYSKGHRLMNLQKPEQLPVVSVISVAAVRDPELNHGPVLPRYRYAADRDLMKTKMRSVLRVAAFNRHRKLVLGALGCGVFGNPNNEVADCWMEVLQENEFQGWWDTIAFAVLDNMTGPDSNFQVFYNKLHGLRV